MGRLSEKHRLVKMKILPGSSGRRGPRDTVEIGRRTDQVGILGEGEVEVGPSRDQLRHGHRHVVGADVHGLFDGVDDPLGQVLGVVGQVSSHLLDRQVPMELDAMVIGMRKALVQVAAEGLEITAPVVRQMARRILGQPDERQEEGDLLGRSVLGLVGSDQWQRQRSNLGGGHIPGSSRVVG